MTQQEKEELQAFLTDRVVMLEKQFKRLEASVDTKAERDSLEKLRHALKLFKQDFENYFTRQLPE